MNNLSPVQTFASLFQGRSDAWDSMTGGCIKQKIILKYYEQPIAGKVSLGIYPIKILSNRLSKKSTGELAEVDGDEL